MIEMQTQSSIPKEKGRVSLATLATFLKLLSSGQTTSGHFSSKRKQ